MDELPKSKIKSAETMRFTRSVSNSNPIKSDQLITALPTLGFFDWKMFLILLLLIIVILSYVGINILNIFGNAIQDGVLLIKPAINSLLDIFGYSIGNTINTVSEVTSNVAKNGIDLADGTVHSVGNLMIGEKNVGIGPKQKIRDPRPDAPEDTIQKSMTSSKSKWCLVGEFQNKRGCIDIAESDKCMSGEIFPNEQMCIFGTPQFQIN